ncbi:MAG: hypothetical protein KTR30_04410 [Saprospiraceae bacterium]|nr:hypothetical protein [Saprospiraceae bacterium]
MRYLLILVCSAITLISCKPTASDQVEAIAVPRSTTYVPTRVLTQGPQHHWFGYYDKLEFDPSGRYVLTAQVDFEGRSPKPDDTIRVGMIDLKQNDAWRELGTSVAWGWQQGCMLQFIPGSASKVIWNDREEDRFVSHIKDIHTGEQQTLPFPIYTLSPDGKTALSVDFERINDLRPGYGYAGIPDPNEDQLAPENAGIYRCDLETGEKELIISIAQMNAMNLKDSDDPAFIDFRKEKNWFNHLLFNTDGSRFVFLHRWKTPSNPKSGFNTLMYSSDLKGEDIRLVDGSGYTSHFIWRDPEHLMMWTKQNEKEAFYVFKDDGSDKGAIIGEDIMIYNGHNTYLPGNEWVLNDTYPKGEERHQRVYLFHIPTKKRIPIGDFYAPPQYKGEWRCDTHPRFSPDGTKVVIDCPVGETGRQLVMMDIAAIIGQD